MPKLVMRHISVYLLIASITDPAERGALRGP